MDGSTVLAFAGGVAVGAAAGYLLTKYWLTSAISLPDPDILDVTCQPGNKITITGTIAAPPVGATLVALHAHVYDDENAIPDATPPAGSAPHGTTFPFDHTLPGGLTGPRDAAVVWAEYRVYVKDKYGYDSCSGSGSGSGSGSQPEKAGMTRPVSAAAADQLEAIPRAYRVSPGFAAAAAGGGLAADLAGALAGSPETVLEYVPEASTPVAPFWRGRGDSGPVREWALCLLHRHGGFGAVLSAVCLVGAREVCLTWVTSEWRFHAANRLQCESDEAGGLPLEVRPA